MTIPTSAEPAPPEPTSLPERLDVLDVLRGFALFGILLVNFTGALPRATSVAGHVVDWFIEVFATGSFYPLFAMLFGMGFVLQFARWEARRAPALRLYFRRVAGLFLFGVAMWCLVATWWILLQYAVAALALLPFRGTRPRILLVAAATFFALTVGAIPAIRSAIDREAGPLAPPEQMRANQQQVAQFSREGPYPALVAARARALALFLRQPRWYLRLGLQPLGLFLLGAAIARSGFLANPAPYFSRLRRLVLWGALLGVGVNIVVLCRSAAGVEGSGELGPLAQAALDLGDTALALAYGAGVLILYTAPGTWHRRLAPLRYAGRTALSNVFLQWIVINTLLLGVGLRLAGHIPAGPYLLLTVLIFATELWLSRRWLARHRFGPLEWLWRTVTYGHPPSASATVGEPGAAS